MAVIEWQGLTLGQAKDKVSRYQFVLEKREMLHMLNTLKVNGNLNPTNFKVGDVFMHPALQHPAIILKLEADKAHAILMTTEESYKGILMKSNSRFYSTAYITSTIVISDIESIKLHGVYDCPNDLKEIRKLLKQYYKKLLNI